MPLYPPGVVMVSILKEAGWALQSIWTPQREEILLSLPEGNRDSYVVYPPA
jgi:hypothetical protein